MGYHWSISHKSEYVAGVVSLKRIGIDIEKIRPYTMGLEKKVADEEEWSLYPMDRSELLFRYWTAKEAVLKTVGIGLAGLSSCKIKRNESNNHMLVHYQDHEYKIEHLAFDNHVAAILTDSDTRIEWTVDDPSL